MLNFSYLKLNYDMGLDFGYTMSKIHKNGLIINFFAYIEQKSVIYLNRSYDFAVCLDIKIKYFELSTCLIEYEKYLIYLLALK